MIESPSNLTEQILNLTERIAVEIKAILNKLNTAVFKVNGVGPDKEGNISLTSVASATKATQDSAGNNIVNTYLTKTSAANTYATKNELESLTSSKVPTNHATTEPTYGSGTSTAYGHVKLSDSTASTLGTAAGTAATPKAVATVYTKATEAYNLASEAKTLAEGALPATGKAVSAGSADTALSANSATKATQDAKGNVIDSTYLTKTDASNTYLVKTAKAASATTADTATKASQDSDGNTINATYLKSATAQSTYLSKTDASSTYLGKTAKAESAKTADSATKATQDGNGKNIAVTYATVAALDTTNTNITTAQTTANDAKTLAEAKVAIRGNRGVLAGYNTPTITSTAISINSESNDDTIVNAAIQVTIEDSTTDRTWIKTVTIKDSSATVTLGSAWKWVNGEAPVITANSILVLIWTGSFGLANLVKGEA